MGVFIAVLVVYVSAVTIRGVDARRGRFDDDDDDDANDRRRPPWYGDNDDDDTKRDMMRDFSKEFMDDFSFDMVDETTGERIRGGMGIVAPTFDRNSVLVGVFLPSRFVDGEVSADDDGGASPEVEISVCEFSKPENCLKEVPYPGAPDEFACGLSDETLDDTGFDCDTGTANLEPDGDLSVEMEVSEEIDDEDRFDDYDYAASPSPAPSPAPMRRRKLLAMRRLSMSRFGRANPRRSRTLRTTGARGYSRG